MEYLVVYEDLSEIWVPHTLDITSTQPWEIFIKGNRRLELLLCNTAADATKVLRQQALKDVPTDVYSVGKECFVDLRSWGYEWYAQLGLPNFDTSTYVVRALYGKPDNKGKRTHAYVKVSFPVFKRTDSLDFVWCYYEGSCFEFEPSKHTLITEEFVKKFPAIMK
jgi:hypothetical protein